MIVSFHPSLEKSDIELIVLNAEILRKTPVSFFNTVN